MNLTCKVIKIHSCPQNLRTSEDLRMRSYSPRLSASFQQLVATLAIWLAGGSCLCEYVSH